ncbi:MAG: KTSC domain-containing protein [Bernardetiaceae bacterium]
MRQYEVSSKIIRKVGYNPETEQLTISFARGDSRCYQAVPPQIYAALMNAPSIGRYYQKHIRQQFVYVNEA